jgi:hypothetical protein
VEAKSVSNRSPASTSAGSNPARSTFANPDAMIDTCSADTVPSRCAAANTGRVGANTSPSMLRR